MKKLILFIILLATTTASIAQNSNNFEWPEHSVTPIFKAFLEAYNSNDFKTLSTFTEKYYPEKKAKSRVIYWTKIFTEYGTLKPYKVADEKFRGQPAIWFQGSDTKNWAKIVLMLTEDSTKIANGGVFKAMRPVGTLPPYKAMPIKDMKKYLNEYLDNLNELDLFSGTVLVAKGNEILFKKSSGYRNKAENKNNNINTTFGIGSTTKTFTAVAIAQLVEQKKLKFSDPLSKFIPEYPKDIANQVTIHDLLTHTSGLEFDDYDPFYYETLKAKSISELLAIQLKYIDHMNEDRRTNFSVLGKFDYSNDNYILLGAIIERVTGISYAEYIENNIFKPANMSHAIVDNSKLANYKNRAKGYSHNNPDMEFQLGERREAIGSAVCNIIMPAGGIHASVKDLYHYFKAINQHKIINKETKEIIFKKHTTKMSSESTQTHIHYGYGFMTNQNGKAISVGHNGVDYGVGSRFEYYPEQDIYVIVLSNYGGMAGSNVADHLRDLIEPND
jgi:CubicO group peptidase (beta-lactamase class C family)